MVLEQSIMLALVDFSSFLTSVLQLTSQSPLDDAIEEEYDDQVCSQQTGGNAYSGIPPGPDPVRLRSDPSSDVRQLSPDPSVVRSIAAPPCRLNV